MRVGFATPACVFVLLKLLCKVSTIDKTRWTLPMVLLLQVPDLYLLPYLTILAFSSSWRREVVAQVRRS